MSQRNNIIISLCLVVIVAGAYMLYQKDLSKGATSDSPWLSGIFGSDKSATTTQDIFVANLPREAEVTLAGRTIYPTFADTLEEQEIGLTNVAEISDDQGMLYVFESKEPASFWNKGMRMSYDLIWILDGTVVGIDSNIPLYGGGEEYLVLDSPGNINGALELAAGWAERYGLKPGDQITATTL